MTSKKVRWNWIAAAALILGSLLLNWPYLAGGFHADDILLLNLIEQTPSPYQWWRGLWSVFEIPAFQSVWWRDADATGTFWRPVPSWVFIGSIRLFGRTALPLHLLSILLHGGVAIILFRIIHRLTGNGWVGFLSGWIFLACEDHTMTVGWIATQTDILCVFFINLAILCHLQWLEHRRLPQLWLSLGSMALAFGCKETAVAAPAALIFLTFLVPGGMELRQADPRSSGWRERFAGGFRNFTGWVPHAALLVMYLAAYKILHLGIMNNLMYVDPLSAPFRFGTHLLANLPVMWLATLSVVPPSLTMFYPDLTLPMALLGTALFIAWILALKPLFGRPAVQWAFLLYLTALLPQMGSGAGERLLYFPMVPGAALLALTISQWGPAARLRRKPPPGIWTRAAAYYVLGGIFLPSIALSAWLPFSLLPSLTKPERDALTALPLIEHSQAENIVVLNGSGPFVTFYLGDIIRYHLGRPVDVTILSAANGKFSLFRSGTSSFTIRTDRPGWLSNMFARVFRTREKLVRGAAYPMSLCTARIEETTPDSTDVLAVQFRAYDSLNDPAILYLYWDGRRFREMDWSELPAGTGRLLADTSDIWASMY